MKAEYREKLWELAKRDMYSDNFIFHKNSFECLLDGMILKIHMKYNKTNGNTNKTPKTEEVLASLERMKRFMETLSYKNCISHFQAKIITAQERTINSLEADKQELIKEITELKKRIT